MTRPNCFTIVNDNLLFYLNSNSSKKCIKKNQNLFFLYKLVFFFFNFEDIIKYCNITQIHVCCDICTEASGKPSRI